jgi:pyruvate dehydrogenase E1 component alpha subunit
MHLADPGIGAIGENGIVGASIFLGTGAALGFQLEGVDRVAVAFFGDGAIGQGILYECLNLAAIWKLPAVFVCEDNQYAHSFASKRLANEGDITARAKTFGIPASRVNGIDALEVRLAAEDAVARARSGDGATVIQALCYRWRGHNLGDGDHLYRPKEEVREARKRDPLAVMRAHIEAVDPSVDLDAIRAEAEQAFADAWTFVESSDAPRPGVVFRDLPA